MVPRPAGDNRRRTGGDVHSRELGIGTACRSDGREPGRPSDVFGIHALEPVAAEIVRGQGAHPASAVCAGSDGDLRTRLRARLPGGAAGGRDCLSGRGVHFRRLKSTRSHKSKLARTSKKEGRILDITRVNYRSGLWLRLKLRHYVVVEARELVLRERLGKPRERAVDPHLGELLHLVEGLQMAGAQA